MSGRYLLCAAILLAASMHAGSVREVYYQGPLAPANTTPTFDKGYLFVYDLDGTIKVYGQDGLPRFTMAPKIAEATHIGLKNAAADSEGIVAAAVCFHKPLNENRVRFGGGLAFFDASGKQLRFVDTGSYLPTQLAFADDDSVWTLGYEQKQTVDEQMEYDILRHYSLDGRELGAFLPRSSFEPGLDPAFPVVGMWSLRVAHERIGALQCVAKGHPAWLELDFSGKELGRWQLPGDHPVGAFTETAALYAKEQGKLVLFDRSKANWQPTGALVEGTLLGSNGGSLVFWKSDSNTLRWITPGVNPIPVN